MIKYNKVRRKGEIKTHISVVEGYRPGPGLPTRQRSIKSFGYLEDQVDPDAFMKEVNAFNANYREQNVPLKLEATGTAMMYSEPNRRFNYGYKFIESIYDMLKIDDFIGSYVKSHKFKGEYSPASVFKFLVLSRILKPDSKRASCQAKDAFYAMNTDFTLPDIYRALDHYANFEVELQRHLNERVKETIGRDLSYAFYDVTNFFCEIDFPMNDDDLRRKGVSKEHRLDPIVAMGLFMDGNGLPVNMSVFPGNTSETKTLKPVMEDVKTSYGLGRLIVVADKGLNSSNNINTIVNNGDGFIFSQILKGKKGQRYNDKLFDDNDWISNPGGTYKYKLWSEEYTGKDKDGKKVTRMRRVLLYWDKSDAEMARRKREDKLKKAAKSISNNAYAIKHGYEEYTKEDIVDKENGEYLENITKVRSVDMEKASKDAMYDGYFCIITSELCYDERQIRKAYHGLWKIEESFRVMKSDLYARPIFVWTNDHICAHFLICFVALLIIRIMQHKMGENVISTERIARALNAANCHLLKGGIIHLDDVGGAIAFKKVVNKKGNTVETLEYSDEDEIALDYKSIQELFGTNIYNIYYRQEAFNKLLKKIAVS